MYRVGNIVNENIISLNSDRLELDCRIYIKIVESKS